MLDRHAKIYGCLLIGFLLWAAGLPAPAQEPPTKPKNNVILFVLDQLQADRLHCYGNPRETSPNMDALAARGARFAHFYSCAPWTAPSYATLMTSQFPSRHGVTLPWRPGMPLISKDKQMLAEVFKRGGYLTAAFVNNWYAGPSLTSRGFDEYYGGLEDQPINISERVSTGPEPHSGIPTTRMVLSWLDEHHSEPFFLWVLFMEPHAPMDPPPEDDIFKSDAYPYLSDRGYDILRGPLRRLGLLGDQKAIERLNQLYDGKIHFIDRYVGKIVDRVHQLGLDDKTLVFLSSDHGELQFSHPKDYLTADHRSPYDPVVHVPFLAAGPGVPAGRVVDAIASNLDSAPTILDLAGLPKLDGAQGRSQVPLIEGKVQSIDPYVFSEEDIEIPWRSVRNARYKLILDLWTNQERLYDLANDSAEQTDVSKQNPGVVKELDAHLQEWIRENQPSREKQLARWRIFSPPLGYSNVWVYENPLVVDDDTIGGRFLMTGSDWHDDTFTASGNYNMGCFWTEGGDGSRTAVWRSDLPMLGKYKISVFYARPAVAGRFATNAPFTVTTETGSQTFRVNFNEGQGQWNLLGTFTDPRFVTLTNKTDGAIVADAVKFERVE